jgi:hypothetical protein
VLYPGDRWEIGTPWDNSAALDAYESDYRRDKRPLGTSPPVAEAELIELAKNYVRRVREKNDVRLASFLERVMPGSLSMQVRIYLWDLKRTVLFDLRKGLEFLENGESIPDAEMSSKVWPTLFASTGESIRCTSTGAFERPRRASTAFSRRSAWPTSTTSASAYTSATRSE